MVVHRQHSTRKIFHSFSDVVCCSLKAPKWGDYVKYRTLVCRVESDMDKYWGVRVRWKYGEDAEDYGYVAAAKRDKIPQAEYDNTDVAELPEGTMVKVLLMLIRRASRSPPVQLWKFLYAFAFLLDSYLPP